MQTATFTMYAFAANTTGNLEQMANVREWLPQGSRSVSDTFTGKIYGKGPKAWKAAQADCMTLNANISRPA